MTPIALLAATLPNAGVATQKLIIVDMSIEWEEVRRKQHEEQMAEVPVPSYHAKFVDDDSTSDPSSFVTISHKEITVRSTGMQQLRDSYVLTSACWADRVHAPHIRAVQGLRN